MIYNVVLISAVYQNDLVICVYILFHNIFHYALPQENEHSCLCYSVCVCVCVCVLVTQSCPTLCDLMDCSPPGSSVHGTLQARILEWITISFSRGSSRPRDQTLVSCTAGRFFTAWVTREAILYIIACIC